MRVGILDAHTAPRDGCRADEAANLDVVRANAELTAVQPVHAVDGQHVRADALDLRAERVEKVAQVLHVRLAGGIADDGRALRQHRGHDGVLGCGDARLVKQDVGPAQAVGLEDEVR